MIKAGGDQAALVIQVWSTTRMVTEILVPKALHGALVNDGYFATGKPAFSGRGPCCN